MACVKYNNLEIIQLQNVHDIVVALTISGVPGENDTPTKINIVREGFVE